MLTACGVAEVVARGVGGGDRAPDDVEGEVASGRRSDGRCHLLAGSVTRDGVHDEVAGVVENMCASAGFH